MPWTFLSLQKITPYPFAVSFLPWYFKCVSPVSTAFIISNEKSADVIFLITLFLNNFKISLCDFQQFDYDVLVGFWICL